MRTFGRPFGLVLASLFFYSARASANGLEIPENGTEVMGRGGAWTARADNALATALNPAGLAGQSSNGVVNANLTWQSSCFQRQGAYPSGGGFNGTNYTPDYYDKPYPEVCKKNGFGNVNVVPQLGFTVQINPKLTLGMLPLWTPSGTGKAEWPDNTLDDQHRGPLTSEGTPVPSPSRFMLLSKNASIIMPTFGLGYEVIPHLKLGASFQWVITIFKSAVSSQGSQSSAQDLGQGPAAATRSDVSFTQLFTPAFVVGAMVDPSDDFDIGAMFRWSADIVKKGGDVTITAPYYGRSRNGNDTPAITNAHLQEFRIPQPWDARLGFRFHPKRKGAAAPPKDGRRDFLSHDQFDIEVDFTYSHNSQFDKLTILFDEGQHVAFGSTVSASYVPPDASLDKHWKDTVGVRIGGEYVVLPNQLGVRLGAFVQSKGQDEAYLNLDFHPGMMFGGYLGATYRVSKTVDVALGYGHIFVKPFDNTATGGQFRGLVGTPPDPTAPGGRTYGVCPQPGPTPAYRTCDAVNTGKLSTSYNMVSLGTTLHF